jgi:L-ascorbate metabolism protein UlaG (beta-lactamase superfamily)
MQLRWLGTAGFELSSGNTSVLIDPYLTRNPKADPVQKLAPADFSHVQAIFITHGHFDHTFDVPAIVKASGATAHASPTVCRSLALNGVPWNKLNPLWPWKRAAIGPFHFGALPACHVAFDTHIILSTLWRSRSVLPQLARLSYHHYPTGDVCGWLIEVEGMKLFHLGSACMLWGVGDDIDIFMVPVQGRTDICEVAAELVKRVNPGMVIPHHHDDFYPPLSQYIDLGIFQAELQKVGVQAPVNIPILNQLIQI